MTDPEFHKIAVNGVELAVWEWPGEGPALLFCHATSFHARCWDRVITRLGGRRAIAIDLRGHGLSSKPAPPYSWREFGQDTAAIVQSLGLKAAVGVGHSMGGHAITLAAALEPDAFSGLVLLDPVIFPRDQYHGPHPGEHYAARRRDLWDSSEEMFERFRDRAPFNRWDPAVLRDYCLYGLLPAPSGEGFVLACPPAVEGAIYAYSSAPEANLDAEIGSVGIPVTVVRSAREPSFAAMDMAASPTDPELASRFRFGKDMHLRDQEHLIPMEAPGLVSDLIQARIRQIHPM